MIRVIDADLSTVTFGVYDVNGAIRVRKVITSYFGLYTTDGSIRVTPSTEETFGRYAPDGSYYITEDDLENGSLKVEYVAPTLGSELLLNNSFDTTDTWVRGAGWSISGGSLHFNAVAGVSGASQPVTIQENTRYLVEYTVTAYTGGGSVKSQFHGGALVSNGQTVTTPGTYTDVLIPAAGNTSFRFIAGASSTSLSISNVSLKKVG